MPDTEIQGYLIPLMPGVGNVQSLALKGFFALLIVIYLEVCFPGTNVDLLNFQLVVSKVFLWTVSFR